MAKPTENQKRDHAVYFLPEGDAGFSPERNRAIVEGVIAKHEKRMLQARKDHVEGVAERSEAVVSFLKHVAQGGHDNIDKYFGRVELARLRGEDKLNRVKRAFGVN